MTKMIMSGCNGRMGRMITSLVEKDPGIEIVAGIDKFTAVENSYPVFDSVDKCDVEATDCFTDKNNAIFSDFSGRFGQYS